MKLTENSERNICCDLFCQIVYIFLSSSAGPINISTTAVLVSPGVAVPGQISITSSEVYFEVDEDHDDFKKIDPQVGRKDRQFQDIASRAMRYV